MNSTFEKMSFLLSIFGALLVLEGIPYFGFPKAVKQWALMLQKLPESRLRMIGLLIMASGLALLYVIKAR